MIIQNLLIILKNHSWNNKQIKISIFKIFRKVVLNLYQDRLLIQIIKKLKDKETTTNKRADKNLIKLYKMN